MHYVEGNVPDGYYSLPLDGPKIIREGSDFTVVSTSYMTLEASMAAEQLSNIGIEVEILDLRVSRPLNLSHIKKSVQKTGRLLTVDLGWVLVTTVEVHPIGTLNWWRRYSPV